PTPPSDPGKSVGKAKRNGQNLSNQVAAEVGADPASVTANATNKQTAMQLFIADIDEAYTEFNALRGLYSRAAEIDAELTAAKTRALNASAALNSNLSTFATELRKSIDHLALGAVLMEQPWILN